MCRVSPNSLATALPIAKIGFSLAGIWSEPYLLNQMTQNLEKEIRQCTNRSWIRDWHLVNRSGLLFSFGGFREPTGMMIASELANIVPKVTVIRCAVHCRLRTLFLFFLFSHEIWSEVCLNYEAQDQCQLCLCFKVEIGVGTMVRRPCRNDQSSTGIGVFHCCVFIMLMTRIAASVSPVLDPVFMSQLHCPDPVLYLFAFQTLCHQHRRLFIS